jgi:HAD superfamily hydrolase (TIGR01549 family)
LLKKLSEGIPFKDILLNIIMTHTPHLLGNIEKIMVDFFEKAEKQIDYKLFPQTEETLRQLYNNKLRLFISTACVRRIVTKKIKPIEKYFETVITSDQTPKSKKHMEELAKYAGVNLMEFSKHAFFVGDTKKDMDIAKECDIYAIGITNTISAEKLKTFGANAIIKNLSELLEINFPDNIFDMDISK